MMILFLILIQILIFTTLNSSIQSLYQNYQASPSITTQYIKTNDLSSTNLIILETQAKYDPFRDANKLTVNSIKNTVAFQRAINAKKGISNLLGIIEQLNSKVNQLKQRIVSTKSQKREAQNKNAQCYNILQSIQSDKNKIQNTLIDKNKMIKNKNMYIEQILLKNEILQNKIINLQNNLILLQNNIQGMVNSVDIANQKWKNCQVSVQGSVQGGQFTLSQQIYNINLQIAALQDKLKKLIQANIHNIPTNRQINNYINNQNKRLLQIQKKCSTQKSTADALTSQLTNLQFTKNKNQEELKKLNLQLNENNKAIDKTKQDIITLQQEISTLSMQKDVIDEKAIRQEYKCNETDANVLDYQQGVAVLGMKLDQNAAWLENARVNLEKARAQSDIADLAARQITDLSTSTLPQAITSTENLNRSLPPKKSQFFSSIAIGDINLILSKTYNQVYQTKTKADTLYPIGTDTIQILFGSNPQRKSSFLACNDKLSFTQNSGVVKFVQGSGIVVQSQGRQIILVVSDCTRLEAIFPNYVISKGSNVYFKGLQIAGQFQLNQLTCV